MRPQTIGIAGPSCSGKTELALELVRRLGPAAGRLPLDAYYRDLTQLDPALRVERNFDHPDALDRELFFDHLNRLIAGEAVEVPHYRFATHSRAPRGRVLEPGAWLIVEGLFALCWVELRDKLRIKVFLDAADDLCLARRLERDVRRRGRDPDAVRSQYARTVRPMFERHVLPTRRHAEMILRGDESIDRLVSLVIGATKR